MKIIEALKLIKELKTKAEDLRKKVKEHAADLDFETPVYPDQKKQIREWIQAHSDVLKEILKLRTQIQATNLAVDVDIQLNGKTVTKSIAAWIHRRRDLAGDELTMWSSLTDKGLKEGMVLNSTTPGVPPTPVKIRRYYDPTERDANMELFRSEPGIIDRTLEVVNATTPILE
jgi:hypothetical protein